MPSDYSEDALIEQPAIALFAELGWQTANCFQEKVGARSTLGRQTTHEVVLVNRLRWALEILNPGTPSAVIELAIEALTEDRSALSPAQANREIYRLLKDGVRVVYRDEADEETIHVLRAIDWERPGRNDFLLASQLWVSGDIYKRRADLVGFVNGIPLVLVELKAQHKRLEDAYQNNLRDYRSTIPQLFQYNAFIILSNGSQSRIGSMTAAWEHFAEWKRVNSEGEAGIVSLETMIRGTCQPARLLDLVENFTVFSEGQGALVKLLAKNHQYLGVNNAVQALQDLRDKQGRLGVFWHTQGSGKSYSMVFFSQKVLRKVPGNWTFLVVTDRQELDDQIYKTFAGAGAVTEVKIQAESGAHLQQLLREAHRNVFTLIQKFHVEAGRRYPTLSERSDIIVMTDEAHRSQYETLALNMRNALPNAAFIAFTGTPLMAKEERTREVFGDYVSIYNFKQSVDDGATVPLFYENRIPELQLAGDELNQELEELIGGEGLDEGQQRKLEREFGREYHLITRDDRLEKIAEDLVSHFAERGQLGKAMAVSIDKATALRMYDKVRRRWGEYLARLKEEASRATGPRAEALLARARWMETTDMAVVVSPAQNEVEDFDRKGLNIVPHRRRMVMEDLAAKFKDPNDSLRLVFVCAMWMTGFDVPNLATIYLDKPMRNHTLMQTIARANRVFEGKSNGLIVDYVGVFRDLQRALAIYASGAGDAAELDLPVQDKRKAVATLRLALADAEAFCLGVGVDPAGIIAAAGFERLKRLEDAVDLLVASDQTKDAYLALVAAAARWYRAILPDVSATEFSPAMACHQALAAKLLAGTPKPDIAHVMEGVESLLDAHITAEGYVIREAPATYAAGILTDLNAIDFDALKARFEAQHKHIEADRLRGAIRSKLGRLIRQNKSRMNYQEQFQHLIDEYNTGSVSVEQFFSQLVLLAKTLSHEEERGAAEGLTEEELAIADLLLQPEAAPVDVDRDAVKQTAREILTALKKDKLVLDWRKRQQTRAQVLTTIRDVLDRSLPAAYTAELYEQACAAVYEHVYDAYYGPGQSVYTSVA